ncbi:MAG: hypothetical protein OXG96_13225 [Acidobacteria bacterium]|nr:hypothetical protein [Acidobacteriota bacterium]
MDSEELMVIGGPWSPALLGGSFEGKKPIVHDGEPRIATNQHEEAKARENLLQQGAAAKRFCSPSVALRFPSWMTLFPVPNPSTQQLFIPHSSFIIHHSPFIIHHSSFIILH